MRSGSASSSRSADSPRRHWTGRAAVGGGTSKRIDSIACRVVGSVMAAKEWARTRGWSDQRSTSLGDVISLHLNVRVAPEHGPEAQLLQAGAGLDVIGLRHWDIAPETVASVLTRYPRHDMRGPYGMP